MNVFSAAQAVSPAIDRTRRFLFHPFRWSTYLKLAAVACITEGFSANLNSSFNHSSSHNGGVYNAPFHMSNEVIALIVLAVLACFAIGIVVFYLVTRLRFAFFYSLLHQTSELRPGWRLYREQAMRFFKMSLLIGLLLLSVAISVMLPFGFKFFDIYRAVQAGGHLDPVRMLLLLLAFIPVAMLLCLALWTVKVVLHDFMLPHVALDDDSVEEAWAEVRSRIEAEPAKFFVYMLLRLILPIVAGIALFLVLAIPLVIVFGGLGLAAAGFNALLAKFSSASSEYALLCSWASPSAVPSPPGFATTPCSFMADATSLWATSFFLLRLPRNPIRGLRRPPDDRSMPRVSHETRSIALGAFRCAGWNLPFPQVISLPSIAVSLAGGSAVACYLEGGTVDQPSSVALGSPAAGPCHTLPP